MPLLNRPTRTFALLPLLCWVTIGLPAGADAATPSPVTPLPNAHAHNDYWHKRPLLDALAHGFTSVEADVFVRDGQLLVGHEPAELRPERSLESLYLKPLAARVKDNGGQVYKAVKRQKRNPRFLLIIDIKAQRAETRQALGRLLARYQDMLTTTANGKTRPGAVTVVLSGAEPRDPLAYQGITLAGGDGRLTDLAADTPPHALPLISDNWRLHFKWHGEGPFPQDQRERLHEIVKQAHKKGRLVRFWATPEDKRVWQELRDAGVDLINTDDLAGLSRFLRDEG